MQQTGDRYASTFYYYNFCTQAIYSSDNTSRSSTNNSKTAYKDKVDAPGSNGLLLFIFSQPVVRCKLTVLWNLTVQESQNG